MNVSPDSFRVRGVTFAKGDPVIVTSRVTGEEFHGEITVVKPKAVSRDTVVVHQVIPVDSVDPTSYGLAVDFDVQVPLGVEDAIVTTVARHVVLLSFLSAWT